MLTTTSHFCENHNTFFFPKLFDEQKVQKYTAFP